MAAVRAYELPHPPIHLIFHQGFDVVHEQVFYFQRFWQMADAHSLVNKEAIALQVSPKGFKRECFAFGRELKALVDIVQKTRTRLEIEHTIPGPCLLYTSPSPRDQRGSRMPSSA